MRFVRMRRGCRGEDITGGISGRGLTCVTPGTRAHAEPRKLPETVTGRGEKGPKTVKMNLTRTIRVVLVDDERRVRESAKRLLEEDQEIDVVGEAGDGRGAVRLAHDLSPNVVVMDISMPTMNGFDAARRILKECPEVHVVLITAMDAEPYRRASLSIGVNAFLSKESLDRDLLKTIHELVH